MIPRFPSQNKWFPREGSSAHSKKREVAADSFFAALEMFEARAVIGKGLPFPLHAR